MQKLFQLSVLAVLLQPSLFGQAPKSWTVMHYAAGCNSSEVDLLNDVADMKEGKKSDDYNLIVLIDRIAGHSEDSTTLDDNFGDTRLYSINPASHERLNGKEYIKSIAVTGSTELNMGDAETLESFIQYCKKYFPAEHYMLVLRSHGSGVAMCPDVEEGETDHLYPAEITNVLSDQESVDILGLDVCSMAGLENLYQWRRQTAKFSADYVLASAPLSGAWAYEKIFERFSSELTPIEFSKLILEEIQEDQGWSSWALVDNTTISKVKDQIDVAARLLVMENGDPVLHQIRESLGYHHNISESEQVAKMTCPYLDAFDFWSRIGASNELSETCRRAAKEVCRLLDHLVVSSYYGTGFLPETSAFAPGKSGVYQIIPQGDEIFEPTGGSFWSHSNWFHPDDRSADQNSYGQYDWCLDGAVRANQKVDNFYEFLDFLFDQDNGNAGGVNGYQW